MPDYAPFAVPYAEIVSGLSALEVSDLWNSALFNTPLPKPELAPILAKLQALRNRVGLDAVNRQRLGFAP